MCIILDKTPKFNTLSIIYQGPAVARNLSTLRSNLESCPHSRGDPSMQPLPCRRAQCALSWPLPMEWEDWFNSDIYMPARALSQCSKQPWLLCCHPSPKIHCKVDAAVTTPAGSRGLSEGRVREANRHSMSLFQSSFTIRIKNQLIKPCFCAG